MKIILDTLCDDTAMYHAREIFTVLCLAYLVIRSR